MEQQTITLIVGVVGVAGALLAGVIGFAGALIVAKRTQQTALINTSNQIEAAYRLHREQLEATARTTQHQIHAEVVLAERMKWVGTLRDSIAEYLGVLYELWVMSTSPGDDVRHLAASSRAHTLHFTILLLLSPDESHHTELATCVTDAFKDVASNNTAKLSDTINQITTRAQKVMRSEWETVKERSA